MRFRDETGVLATGRAGFGEKRTLQKGPPEDSMVY